jgi:hypothetical protein
MTDTEMPAATSLMPAEPEHPVRGRGKGKGKHATSATKEITSKPAVKKGRGRVKKLGDDRAQAAYERCLELKNAYQQVARAIKPALQELAERQAVELLEKPNYYRELDTYQAFRDSADARLRQVTRNINREYEANITAAEMEVDGGRLIAQQTFNVCILVSPYPHFVFALFSFFSLISRRLSWLTWSLFFSPPCTGQR